jgi:hypothetical protein
MREIRTSGLTRGRGISSLPTLLRDRVFRERESAEDLDVDRTPYCDYNDHIRGIRRMQL